MYISSATLNLMRWASGSQCSSCSAGPTSRRGHELTVPSPIEWLHSVHVAVEQQGFVVGLKKKTGVLGGDNLNFKKPKKPYKNEKSSAKL